MHWRRVRIIRREADVAWIAVSLPCWRVMSFYKMNAGAQGYYQR
jgi:hypothetical protein